MLAGVIGRRPGARAGDRCACDVCVGWAVSGAGRVETGAKYTPESVRDLQ
jgi:hypothetical protein